MNLSIAPHWARSELEPYPTSACARMVNVSTNYFRAVLNGHHRPSAALESRIKTLVNELKNNGEKQN